jgi:hypothetical protein
MPYDSVKSIVEGMQETLADCTNALDW